MKQGVDSVKNWLAEQSDILKKVPTTRYQGSKRSILPWIYENLKDLKFKTVLDGFGGTGSVSYLFKLMGKEVTFNDILTSNYLNGIALIENDSVKLNDSDLQFITHRNGFKYSDFIQETFKDVYYLDKENRWLDVVAMNIKMLSERYRGKPLRIKRALAYYVLFQACLCKRPFNLFHRKNLYLRTAQVKRTFGNLTTWNRDFKELIERFSKEVSEKLISNNHKNKAICADVMTIKDEHYDLVYFDPPYTRLKEDGPKDYHSLYHFLEGLVKYDGWENGINWNTENRCLIKNTQEWDKNKIEDNFRSLFEKFKDSIIVVSYGEPGYPSIRTLTRLLKQYKKKVRVIRREYKYSLNRSNGNGMHEVLLIGQ